jgi:hypothetical protein
VIVQNHPSKLSFKFSLQNYPPKLAFKIILQNYPSLLQANGHCLNTNPPHVSKSMYDFNDEIRRHLEEFFFVHPVFMYPDAPVISAGKAAELLNLLFISSLFWVVMRRCLVVSYRRYGTAYRSHLKGSSSRRRLLDPDGADRLSRNVGGLL